MSSKSVQQECLTRVFQSIEREFCTRVCHKSVEQECQEGVSHKSVPQECLTRVSHKSMPQDYHARVPYTIVREECQARVFCKSGFLMRSSIPCSIFISFYCSVGTLLLRELLKNVFGFVASIRSFLMRGEGPEGM